MIWKVILGLQRSVDEKAFRLGCKREFIRAGRERHCRGH